MTPDSLPPETSATESPLSGPPFDAEFFTTVLAERVSAVCATDPGATSVVLVHLADGTVLDVCHIEQLLPRWMAAMVFRETGDDDEMDLVLVPYALVTRVTISLRPAAQRPIGFRAVRRET